MRTLMNVRIPVDGGNKAIRDGLLQSVVTSAIEELKPEASYFYSEGGERTALLVFDLKDPSLIPLVAERFRQGLSAQVQLTPAMNFDDLKKGWELVKGRR